MTYVSTNGTCDYAYNSLLQFKNFSAIARIATEDNSIIRKWMKIGVINNFHCILWHSLF
jgi:hypothetical protein